MASELTGKEPDRLQEAAASILEEAAAGLRSVLIELAARLQPFPSFMGMVSIQAIELEPSFYPREDKGCVVVLPGGEICQLDLTVMPGANTESHVDHIEQLIELDLTPEEYIIYATSAINALTGHLRKRGQ